MRMRRSPSLILVGAAALAVALLTGGTAQAQISQVCGNAGTGYCLNDWNNGGSGNPVKMYYGGYTNDDFYYEFEYICNGTDIVQVYPGGGCPFTPGTGLNSLYKNDYILEIHYANRDNCVATTSGGLAVLGSCAESSGGASDGVFMVANPNCSGGDYLVDRYWSDLGNTTYTLASGGNIGVQALFENGNTTCWA